MRAIGSVTRFRAVSVSFRHARRFASSSSSAPARRTALYELHVKEGGTMVEFGGFQMPLQYKGQSISDSVIWTRSKASRTYAATPVCSVTDRGANRGRFTGPHVIQFLQRLVPTDLEAIAPSRSSLSVLMNEKGGIIDDLMITKLSDKDFYIVTNATEREKDLAHIRDQFSGHDDLVRHDLLDDRGLIALQGPSSAEILQKLTSQDLNTVKFGGIVTTTVLGVPEVFISRGGYTGEDGFEISIPGDEATVSITQALIEYEDVKLAGLAARDSLRLEAGLCLYGHDLDQTTSPIEAGLSWLVGKSRTGYLGYDTVNAHMGNLPGIRRRVGFIVQGAPARGYTPGMPYLIEGANISSEDGQKVIGVVTSGAPSPTLNQNIAMGYVEAPFRKAGTNVNIWVRGKKRPAVVTKTPFVPTKYFK